MSKPRQPSKFVYRCHDKTGKPSVEWLIDCHDRKRAISFEQTIAIDADYLQIAGLVWIWPQKKRIADELGSTPGTVLQRDGRRLVVVVLERYGSRTRRVLIGVAFASHSIRRGCHSNPQADLEGPLTQLGHVLFAFQFQGTDHRRSPSELLQRK